MPQRELDPFVHYQIKTVTLPLGAPEWVPLDLSLPSGRLRFWLDIPHPGVDFEIRFGTDGPERVCTDGYQTPYYGGFGKTMIDEISIRSGVPYLNAARVVQFYVFFSATPDFGN